MHRIGSPRYWIALLSLVALAGVLTAHGRTAAAVEDSRASGADATAIAPYLPIVRVDLVEEQGDNVGS